MKDYTENMNFYDDEDPASVEQESQTQPAPAPEPPQIWEAQTEGEAFAALPSYDPSPDAVLPNKSLIPAIQSRDLLLLDYPAYANRINEMRQKGHDDSIIREVLAEDEMGNGLRMNEAALDNRYGRTKESKQWSGRVLEMQGYEEIAKVTGLKPDDIRERKLVADKLGLSLSAVMDDSIYKVARDQVTVIDDFITAGKTAAKAVQLNQRAAHLIFNSMGRDLTAEEQSQLDEINKEIAKYSNVVYKGMASDISAATTNLLVQQGYGLMTGAKWLPAYVAAAGAANLAYGGAAGAMLNPLGAAAVGVKSFAEGMSMTALAGAFENSSILEASGIYQDLLQIPGINKKVAALVAGAGGVLNGYIEVGNLATMFKTIPGMKKLGDVMGNFFKGAAGEAIKEGGGMRTLLAAPSIRNAIIEGLKNYAEGVTSETKEEIQQAFVSILARELTTRAYGQDGKSLRECVKELMDEGKAALGQMAKGMAPGALINTVSASYHANKAARAARTGGTVLQGQQAALTGDDKARYDAVQQSLQRQNARGEAGEAPAAEAGTPQPAATPATQPAEGTGAPAPAPEAGAPEEPAAAPAAQETTATESPTIEATAPEGPPVSAPQAVREEAEAPSEAQEEVGSDTVFIKTEALDEYMQSLPPADQRTLQEALGWQTIEKSEATGEYFIPGEKFRAAAKQVKGLNNAVGMDLRQGVQGVTLREQQQAMERLRQLTSDPMESSEPFAVEAQNVREDLVKQLRGGGQSAELARANADLMSHYIFNFARTLAMNDDGTLREGAPGPQALYEKLQIKSEKGVQQQAAVEDIAQSNNGVYMQDLLTPSDYDENGNVRSDVVQEIKNELAIIRSEAEKNGTYLVAPNGKPSNLKAGLWEMVRTRRFREWFGNSQIVDANGEPKVVYHGTTRGGFTEFDTGGARKTIGAGAFFTDNDRVASTYAEWSAKQVAPEYDENGELVLYEGSTELPLEDDNVLYPVFLKIEHPYVVDAKGKNWDNVGEIVITDEDWSDVIYEKADGTPFMDEDDAWNYIENELEDPDHEKYQVSPSSEMTTDEIARAVYNNDYGGDYVDGAEVPYDGVIFENVLDEGPAGRGYSGTSTVYTVPTPEQIKSTDNRGTFDAEGNIFYQDAAPKNIAKLTSEERTIWDEAVQGLTESERSRIESGNVSSARGFVSAFRIMPSIDEYAAAAIAGRAKKGWYARSAVALREIFGEDTDRFTALLAATSPRCSVETNLMNSLKVWKAWNEWTQQHPGWEQWDDLEKRRAIIQVMRENMQQADQAEEGETGKQTEGQEKKQNEDKATKEKLGPVLPSWINNTVTALTTPDAAKIVLSGPKVNSFMYNLRGDPSYVTNDTWMAIFIGRLRESFSGSEYKPEQGDAGYSLRYLAMNARVRLAAEMLTQQTGEKWEPDEVQETIWSWGKTLTEYAKNLAKTQKNAYNESGGKGDAPVVPSFREIIDSGVITDEMIGSTVDFAQLVTQGDGVNDYRAVLEEAGYGEQLKQLDTEIEARSSEGRGPESSADQGTVRHAPAAGLDGRRDALYRVADRFDASFRGRDEIHKKLLAVRSKYGTTFGSQYAYSDGYQNRGDVSDQNGPLGIADVSSRSAGPYRVNRGREESGRHSRGGRGLEVEFDLGLKKLVKVKAAAEYVLDRGVAVNLTEVRAATPRYYELAMDEKNVSKSASAFRRALLRARKSQGIVGLCVEVKSLEAYMGQKEDPDSPKITKLFLAEGGLAGFAITEDGDIVSAFSMKGAPIVDGKETKADKKGKFPSSVFAMLMLAVQNGGRHLDCFDTVLPSFYSYMGFRAVARCAWNETYKPTGWDDKVKKALKKYNKGEPDVVFMVYDPDNTALYKKGEGVMYADYGAASKAAKQVMSNLREQSQALAQQTGTRYEQSAASDVLNTEHGWGAAVNEKGQPVGGNKRYEQTAWHGTGENAVIERFSREKSNSGAGGNAHGAGALYGAQDRLVAAGYREEMSDTEFLFTKDGQRIDPKLAGALSRHVNSIRNVAADGLALDEDSRVLKDLADVQELAKGTRAGKTFMARLIDQYQALLDRIDADPEMTPQDFYNLMKEAPFRNDDMAPSNIADAYHAATQNAIRAGKPAATIEDVRHVIEEGLLPNKLWRDELYADAELLANADLTGIRAEARQSGALYEVEIPENEVLLNEQLRFNAQPKVVKDGIRAAFEKLTHEQKRDFAENILPWSEAKEEVFTSKASGIKTVLDYLNKPEEYINGLFKDISDPRAIPPKVLNARSVLKNYFGYTDAQIDTFSATRKAAMAEAEKVIANVDEARARLQEEYEKAHAEEVAREEAFFKKELFTKLRNSRTIEGRDIYDAFAYALRGDNFENQMAASLALNDAGIKGITYDGAQDGRCFVIFDEDAIEIVNRYQQEKAQGQARGYIEFGKNGESIIGLLKDADQSTFIHEMGHMMLENLVRFGQDKDASAQVKRDLQTALEFLGIKDASEIRVEHHEKFARAFEVYLMTAKAPNSKLRQVFAKMKRWLLSIYHQARVLNAEINPALQDLFDRMLAGPVEEDGGNATLNELQEASTVAAERIKALEAEIEAYKHEPRDARRAFTAGRKVGTEMQKLRMSEKLAALREKYALREERRKERLAEMKQRQKERAALKKEIQRIVKGIEKARKQKSIIWAARQEIEKLLEGYTLKKPSPERMAKAQYLYDYLVDHPDGPVRFEDYAPEDQEAIRMLGTTTLPDMTVDELRQLAAKVEEIRQRGRDAYERWKAEKQARRNGMFNDCFTALGKIPDEGKVVRGPQDLRKEYKGIKGALQKVGDWTYAATLGSHRLFDWIGNGKGLFKSAWTKYFVEAVNTAHDEYLRNANDRRVWIENVIHDYGMDMRDFSRSRVVDGQQYTVDEMLSVYALMQNEKGRKALLFGNFKGLADPETHAAHIVQALTQEERNIADAVLYDYDYSFDRLNQRFIEVYNDGMVKEEHYSPMKRLEYTTNEGIMDSEDADMFAGRTAMQGAAAMVTSLEKGFLIKRMEISEENQQPVDLGLLSIWNEQVTAQEHTAAFAQLAGDLTSVLYRRDDATGTSMAKAIRMTKGSEAWQSVIGYTNLVIMNEAKAAHNVLNKLSSTLGRNMSMVYLAGSISVYLKQWMSLPRFLLSGNPVQLLATVGDYMRRPKAFMAEVYKLDPQIKERVPNAFYKLTKIDPTAAGELGYLSEEMLKKLMFLGAYQDRVTAAIGWKAVYDSEIKRGRSQKEAVQAAQRAVALTQQVPNLKDMPAFWRQSGLAKLMMIFSSNSVPLWGMTAYDMAQAIKRGDISESFWTIMGLTAAAMGTAMVVSGPPSGDDDDTWWNWFLSAMTEQTITSLPVVGKEIYAAYDELINKNRRGSTYSALVTPFVKSAQGVKRMTAEDSDTILQSGMSKFEAGAWQAAEGLGLLLGYMPVTMARRIRTAMSSEDGWQAIQTLCAIRKNQQVKKAVSW